MREFQFLGLWQTNSFKKVRETCQPMGVGEHIFLRKGKLGFTHFRLSSRSLLFTDGTNKTNLPHGELRSSTAFWIPIPRWNIWALRKRWKSGRKWRIFQFYERVDVLLIFPGRKIVLGSTARACFWQVCQCSKEMPSRVGKLKLRRILPKSCRWCQAAKKLIDV